MSNGLDSTTATQEAGGEEGRYIARYTTTGRPVTHGTRGAYTNWGCRCKPCTEANTSICTEAKKSRTAGQAIPGFIKHGTFSTYSNWGCRCEGCRAAAARWRRERRARKDG